MWLLFTDLSDHLPVFQITHKAQVINTNYKSVKYRQVNKESINNLCLHCDVGIRNSEPFRMLLHSIKHCMRD